MPVRLSTKVVSDCQQVVVNERSVPQAAAQNGRTVMAETYSGEAYCVKCKAKREFTGEVHTNETNGRRMAKGKCPVCDTTLTRILGKKPE